MKISNKEKETHRSDEPEKIPFKLLAEITNGFCEEAKLGSGTFGEVYKVCTLPKQLDPCFSEHRARF